MEIMKRVNIYEDNYQAALYELFEAGDIPKLLKAVYDTNVMRRIQVTGLYYRYTGTKASKFEWDNPLNADGVPIFARTTTSTAKVNHKNHTAYDQKITTNKASYVLGNPVKIDDDLREALKKTDFDTIMYELVQSATRGGNGFLLLHKEGDVISFKKINEWECVSVYHPITGELVFSVRYYQKIDTTKGSVNLSSSNYVYELYQSEVMSIYEGSGGNAIFKSEEPHDFEGVPLIEYPNNTERTGDIELTISLQDAFDIADSDLSSEISQLRLAYLALIGAGLKIDDEFVETIKQTGVIALEGGEGKASASFIEKNLNATAIENLKADLERRIYAFSNSYNPDELGESGQMTAYQIRQKLFALDNSSNETITQFTKSLQYTLGLVLGSFYEGEIDFVKNIPRNALEDVKMAVETGFQFSQDTIARFIPLPIDQKTNAKELAAERAKNPPLIVDTDLDSEE